MNKKWRIILSICLVIAICVPMASAAIHVPGPKKSFTLSPVPQMSAAKTTHSALDTSKAVPDFSEKQATGSFTTFQKPNLSCFFGDQAIPDFGQTHINPSGEIIRDPSITVTKDQAIEMALAQFPGIVVTEPIEAKLKRIDAPGLPLCVNPCWIVFIEGYNPASIDMLITDGTEIIDVLYRIYGGYVYIDAVTGEVLYINRPI